MIAILVLLGLILAGDSHAATMIPEAPCCLAAASAASEKTETLKNVIGAAANAEAAKAAKQAKIDASKAQSAATNAETDRKTQIDIAQEAARKANADAAQARSDLKLTRDDAARESAAIRDSQLKIIDAQNRLGYWQLVSAFLTFVVGAVVGLGTVMLQRHMVATRQQGVVIAEQGSVLSRVATSTDALVAALEKAHQQGKNEGAAEEKAKK